MLTKWENKKGERTNESPSRYFVLAEDIHKQFLVTWACLVFNYSTFAFLDLSDLDFFIQMIDLNQFPEPIDAHQDAEL